MTGRTCCSWTVLVSLFLWASIAIAQSQSKTYTDSRGKKIVFPLGDASFADEVVSLEVGNPAPPDKRWTNPQVAWPAKLQFQSDSK